MLNLALYIANTNYQRQRKNLNFRTQLFKAVKGIAQERKKYFHEGKKSYAI